ncbi:MAG: hypothetical protein KKA07_04650 [Bacteroidetes bacterium]|nr:hypothetical protein [Bacteroidota bacterium]MBU1718342.1 hypothetical protein [Bacteroidota bacterium]
MEPFILIDKDTAIANISGMKDKFRNCDIGFRPQVAVIPVHACLTVDCFRKV